MVYLRPDPAREPGFVFYHGRRTAQIALKLAGQIDAQVDRDILYAGALFHDVGKGSNPHNEVGAHMVRDLLGGVCQPEELERICQIVREHNQRRQPNAYAPETRLVQDADLLDHVGPIGPWLTFYWNATHGETIDDALCFFHSEENAHLQESTRNALNLDISVRIFDQRIAFERQFFAALERAHTEGL
jgi:uncharacterized protein